MNVYFFSEAAKETKPPLYHFSRSQKEKEHVPAEKKKAACHSVRVSLHCDEMRVIVALQKRVGVTLHRFPLALLLP